MKKLPISQEDKNNLKSQVSCKQVTEALCNLITTGDEVDRCYAAKTLGKLKAKQAVPTLIKCLRDEDVDVVIDAVEALGNIADPTIIPTLLESLTNDPDGEVKTAIVESLAKIDAPEAQTSLLEVAQTNPENVIWDETNEWNAWWDMQLIAVKSLGDKQVSAAVPILAAILIDEDGQDIESEVLTALAKIGGDGEKILIQRLNTGTAKERRRAATALGLSNSQTAQKALVLALADKKVEVRIAVVKALKNATKYFNIILRLLQDPEPDVRQAVIEIVALIASPEQLIPLLTDSSPKIRAAALKALYNVPNLSPETLIKIHSCLTEQDNTVVIAAVLLLANLQDQSVIIGLLQILSDIKRDKILRSQTAFALGILGNLEAVSILTWAIGDKEQIVRLAALNALMQLANLALDDLTQTANPLRVIIATLKGQTVIPEASLPEPVEPATPVADIEKVTENSPQSTLESIKNSSTTVSNEDSVKLLQNSELEDVQEYMNLAQKNIKLGEQLFFEQKMDIATDVRYLSASILGNSDKPEVVKALIEVLNDADLKLRLMAVIALGQIAKRSPKNPELPYAIESLLANLAIDTIRLDCIRTLGYFGGQNDILLNYLSDSKSSIRVQVIESLTDIDAKQISKIIELLQDVDLNVRKAATILLAKLQCVDALDAMIDCALIADGAIAREVGKCLGSLDSEQSSIKLLQKLKVVPDSSYRRFIIEMLEEVHNNS
ncbi:MAG: HEAT repeat domain-containing protein [Candidatus Marithrix sp.]|nr:HEAT repeat domain-containing protein [Candidatus Marithrix sp.]